MIHLKEKFERIYSTYSKRKFAGNDPVNFLYRYKNREDIETAGLIASSLAYGNVKQINRSISLLLGNLGDSPFSFIKSNSTRRIKIRLKGFRHRFTGKEEISCFLANMKKVVENWGSIYGTFISAYETQKGNFTEALYEFARRMNSSRRTLSLIPNPDKKSAFKRLNLYFRWMVRKDNIDLGIWKKIPTSKLIIPLDTHIHRIALKTGMTKRSNVSMETALEITEFFRKINPADPVKYDFALTRPGINKMRETRKGG